MMLNLTVTSSSGPRQKVHAGQLTLDMGRMDSDPTADQKGIRYRNFLDARRHVSVGSLASVLAPLNLAAQKVAMSCISRGLGGVESHCTLRCIRIEKSNVASSEVHRTSALCAARVVP